MWLAGLASAFMIKLTSSIDDVVWLAPFLTSNVNATARIYNSVIYTSVCLTQTFVAMFMASTGNAAVAYFLRNYPDAWSSDKILTVGAGSLLAIYAVKLTCEYFSEDEDEPADNTYQKVASSEPPADGDEPLNRPPPGIFCCGRWGNWGGGQKVAPQIVESGADDEENPSPDGAEAKSAGDDGGKTNEDDRSQTLFVIAFIGSVDDLTVFVPMLVGKAFDLAQLIVGALGAAVFIVVLCIFLGMCKPVADCLSSVPLALIVGIFATSLLAKGFTME